MARVSRQIRFQFLVRVFVGELFTCNVHSTQREQSEQYSSSDEEVNHRFPWSRFRSESLILNDLSSGVIVSAITLH